MADNGKPVTKRYLKCFGALYGEGPAPKTLAPRKRRTYPERDLVHLPVMSWARRHNICAKHLIHIANERKTSVAQGAMLKLMGVKSGVSDLFLAFPRGPFHGYWIELKAPGGKLTELQRDWLKLMHSVGFKVGMFDDAEKCILAILEYLQ